ncbi:MAG: CsgG/HfaB family protein [Pseudomonadota bacterium]
MTKTTITLLRSALLLILTIMGTSALAAQKGQQAQREYVGPKQVVAVLPFENRVEGIPGNWLIGEGLAEVLVTELIASNRYLLVERDAIQNIVREQELGMSGLVRSETAVPTGQLAGAQFMIKGAITEFNAEAGGGGLTVAFREAEAGAKTRKAYVGIDVRIVDNLTGRIHASYNAHAEARSGGASLAAQFLGSDDFKIGASGFYDTALGIASRDAIRQIIDFILIESAEIPWQGSVIQSRGRNVFINRGASANVKVGDAMELYSKGEPMIDPETGFNLGSMEEFLCGIEVTQVQREFASARVERDCQGLVIERGDIVRYGKIDE